MTYKTTIEEAAWAMKTDVETILGLIGVGHVDVIEPCANVAFAVVDLVQVAKAFEVRGSFICAGCGLRTPWDNGAADDMPEHCDECWGQAHPKGDHQ